MARVDGPMASRLASCELQARTRAGVMVRISTGPSVGSRWWSEEIVVELEDVYTQLWAEETDLLTADRDGGTSHGPGGPKGATPR